MSEWTKDLIAWLILTAIIFAVIWQFSQSIGNEERHISHVSIQKIGGVNGEVTIEFTGWPQFGQSE